MDPKFVELVGSHLQFLNDRPLTADSPLRDLGLDSMRSIDLLFAIEDVLGVSLPDEDLNDATFATAGSLWRAVSAARSATGTAPETA
ncbi:acyl carrier protein [Streptomyces sp. TRM 70361]|uniref:acyl carrier protein n=1 Tax=Streptomyces sp. TRM 70361 TaxID=3116553 RepID=UPI002E7ADBFC|nr:acyl carrier protein [Streptomyces sp. TRM 70361]MEE1942755.1 acyl carrier protein [Streptomyces sp. TRM 70361]